MTSCCFFVSLSSLCFATDEDGRAVENVCNTLFKCINYNLHEEMFCFNVKVFRYTFFPGDTKKRPGTARVLEITPVVLEYCLNRIFVEIIMEYDVK